MTVSGKIQKFKMRDESIKELGLEEAARMKTARMADLFLLFMLAKKGSSLFRVGNRIIEYSVSPPSRSVSAVVVVPSAIWL